MAKNYQLKLKPIAELAKLDQESLFKELRTALHDSIPEWNKEARQRASEKINSLMAKINERIHSNKLQKKHTKMDKKKEKNLELKERIG